MEKVNVSAYSVIWSRSHALVSAALPERSVVVVVSSLGEFLNATSSIGAVGFVDLDRLPELAPEAAYIPIVALTDNMLREMIGALEKWPWLSHLLATDLLSSALARPYLAMLMDELESWPARRVAGVGVGVGGVGRVSLVGNSNRRAARVERMCAFFLKHGISERTTSLLSDAAEELVANALYDAPFEGGYFKKAMPRTEDVDLPPNFACEISYGVDEGNVFLRVRDPFGALSRGRVISVLERCSKADVVPDESRGGAGLGLWRVFSAASTIAITVVARRLTDILIGIATKDGRSRPPGKRLLGVHLSFNSNSDDSVDADEDALDKSVAISRSDSDLL